MITIISKPRILRQYLVYDLEWVPSKYAARWLAKHLDWPIGQLPLRMVGVYDGQRYRWYRTIEQFLLNELTHKNRGKWFYAHAGGLADFQFVLEAMLKRHQFQVKASFSGSSAIIVHVTRGKNSWHFIDSYWLMRDTLRNIGKWVGIEKGNIDENEEFYYRASDNELRMYNEMDCIILYRAIAYFEYVLLELGGQLKMTQASSAMELFRRRFLKADIETSKMVNETARKAYFASRVEVLMKECRDSLYYDINSSFPYAMTFPLPGNLIGTFQKRLPPIGLWLADCTVEIPDNYLPALPLRTDGRIFFPIGIWRGWYSNIDIRLLEESGGRILQVHESMAFEPNKDCRDYALTLFNARKQVEGFPKLAYKYLLNSLYGKFAESEYKNGFAFNPQFPNELRAQGWEMVFPGCFIFEHQVPVPHMHVPISVHITAIARRTLFQYMNHSTQVHYCDTDGFSTETPLGIWIDGQQEEGGIVGKELGMVKMEKPIKEGRFAQAKVYQLEGPDGTILSKAKGFSRMNPERFQRLMQGEEIEYTRMRRIKELLRAGNMCPHEDVIFKRLRNAIPKRFFYPDGQSRPWHVSELEDLK